MKDSIGKEKEKEKEKKNEKKKANRKGERKSETKYVKVGGVDEERQERQVRSNAICLTWTQKYLSLTLSVPIIVIW